ncbi:hypothetical protein B0H11DRAFT_1900650 [Mycena galericulata]|nr:hypothetical protein B0H11DRAFT_1900650 [Mycena galericulata]
MRFLTHQPFETRAQNLLLRAAARQLKLDDAGSNQGRDDGSMKDVALNVFTSFLRALYLSISASGSYPRLDLAAAQPRPRHDVRSARRSASPLQTRVACPVVYCTGDSATPDTISAAARAHQAHPAHPAPPHGRPCVTALPTDGESIAPDRTQGNNEVQDLQCCPHRVGAESCERPGMEMATGAGKPARLRSRAKASHRGWRRQAHVRRRVPDPVVDLIKSANKGKHLINVQHDDGAPDHRLARRRPLLV